MTTGAAAGRLDPARGDDAASRTSPVPSHSGGRRCREMRLSVGDWLLLAFIAGYAVAVVLICLLLWWPR